jgi:LacI family transcriptional regulator
MKPPLSLRPTLADVARLAGVSLGSASRALSVPDQVKPKTLERVNAAVKELGYIRHGAARALASRRTHTVAAIYPTLNNPIFAHSTHSMQQTLWDMGYQLLIASHEYHFDDEEAVLRATVETGVDGIIMVGTDHRKSLFELLENRRLPYVLTWSVDDTTYPHCVGISNYHATYELTKRVLAKGHRKIAICGGAIDRNERARGRRAGIIDAARESGIAIPEMWIVEQPFSYDGGRLAIEALWRLKDRPSVVMCGTDLQAIGAVHACRQMGINVPDELSITGFDGIDEAAMMQPPITTVCIPAHDIGVRAARLIVELIEGRHLSSPPPLQATLAERESLGSPSGPELN